MTFDAGKNSPPTNHLAELGLHFVGSLPPSEHPDLLALPAAPLPAGGPDRSAG